MFDIHQVVEMAVSRPFGPLDNFSASLYKTRLGSVMAVHLPQNAEQIMKYKTDLNHKLVKSADV